MLQGLFVVRCHPDLEPSASQRHLEESANGRRVVHNQYLDWMVDGLIIRSRTFLVFKLP
jgi:hypothetical protein